MSNLYAEKWAEVYATPSKLEAYVIKKSKKYRKPITRREYAAFRQGFEHGIAWAIGILSRPNSEFPEGSELFETIEREKFARAAGAKTSAYFPARFKTARELWKDAEFHNLRIQLEKHGEQRLLEKLMTAA